MSIVRDNRCRLVQGNPGGPGRPRRTIEREYLAALSNVVSIDDWRQIVARAVEAANAGDAKARDWLSRLLLGKNPPSLLGLAAKERRGVSVEDDLAAEGKRQEGLGGWPFSFSETLSSPPMPEMPPEVAAELATLRMDNTQED